MGSLDLTLTIFLGLLSITLSLILYFKARRRKRLTFTYELTELQTRSHPEIRILFKDIEIENLSRLRAVMWNSGNQEIRRSDIPTDGAPSVLLSGARVLSVAVLEASADTKCTARENNEKTVSIDFEFLNPGDHATLDIVFESDAPKSPRADFSARVIGGVPCESRHFEPPLTAANWTAPIFFALAWCLGAAYWISAVPRWVHIVPAGINFKLDAIWSSLGLVVGLFFCAFIFHEYFRRHRCSRLPRAARKAFTR